MCVNIISRFKMKGNFNYLFSKRNEYANLEKHVTSFNQVTNRIEKGKARTNNDM